MTALEARAWLTSIDGIGKKTASVLLLFSFGLPLMPVDRHVERVALRVGLIPKKASADDAHDLFLGLLEPDEMHEAHVNLIQHGRHGLSRPTPGVRRLPVASTLPVRGSEGALSRRSGVPTRRALHYHRPMTWDDLPTRLGYHLRHARARTGGPRRDHRARRHEPPTVRRHRPRTLPAPHGPDQLVERVHPRAPGEPAHSRRFGDGRTSSPP